ncbi:type VII secretion target [Gordonia sp. PKS22-38]|uniref:Type VII secretion target n=1 Tax=Gordonia prachuapensis TaxID=3115651 RepID=A0ABU7MXK6_9ACTN|nr:type VII secretion target [Gordonia sp. PKS22-38]
MDINSGAVVSISNGWGQAHHAITEAASKAGDSSGDWAPAVQGAVAAFASEWRDDLNQLAAEANTTSTSLVAAARTYEMTDDEAAQLMGKIQASRASGS